MPTRWMPPQDALDAVAGVSRRYDNPPPWDGGANCTGGLRPGSQAFGALVMRLFPGVIRSAQGYACRPNTANSRDTSLHGTGRAVDLMVVNNGDQSREADAVANWILHHAGELGVQEVIWTRSIWTASRGFREYAPTAESASSHTDHIHVGLSAASADRLPDVPGLSVGVAAPVVGSGVGSPSQANHALWVLATIALAAGAIWYINRET